MPEEKIQPTSPVTTPPVEAPPPLPPKESPYPLPKSPSKPDFLERFWFVFVLAAIVSLIILGALFFLNRRSAAPEKATPTPTLTEEVDETTRELEEQGTSDEIEAIEADLEATDLSELDKELSDIENELPD